MQLVEVDMLACFTNINTITAYGCVLKFGSALGFAALGPDLICSIYYECMQSKSQQRNAEASDREGEVRREGEMGPKINSQQFVSSDREGEVRREGEMGLKINSQQFVSSDREGEVRREGEMGLKINSQQFVSAALSA